MSDPSGASMPVPTGTEYEPRQSVQPAAPQQQAQRPAQTGLGRGGTAAVQNWQRRYNRQHGFKPGMPGYLKDDGLWGPATKAAYEQMQAAKQPVAPEQARELPPMPGTPATPAPAAPQLEGTTPQKVDIVAADARKAVMALNQQIWKDLANQGVDVNSKLGRDAFRAVQNGGYQAAYNAAKKAGGDQAAIQQYVQNYLKQYYLTPNFLQSYKATK